LQLVASGGFVIVNAMLVFVLAFVGGSLIRAAKKIDAALARIVPVLELSSANNSQPARAIAAPSAPAAQSSGAAAAQEMARHVQLSARGWGVRCLLSAFAAILYAASRPSPIAFFEAQNRLPPMLSGQLVLWFWTTLVIDTSVFTAFYLQFWMVL
jgi:hypothetical protein